jgi:hypothetical protein
MFGFTGLQRVEAVYVPNRFDTGIIWTGIVARDGPVELWHFELTPAVPASAAPRSARQPQATDLAKVKNQAKDANRKKGGNGNV